MRAHPLSPAEAAAQDRAECRRLLRNGSRTFLAASHLLPRAVRDAACALYAFCRLADDAVDISGRPDAALEGMRVRLDRIYAGHPLTSAADRAVADVVQRFALPRALPDALLEGFEWDACGRRYRTLEDLEAYAARVAGTVGAMMAVIMNVRDPEVVARACDLGVAMQLSNIARDVGEDARAGRLYLPLDWLSAAGVDIEDWMRAPSHDAGVRLAIERLLARAEELYQRADQGIAQLPRSCRPGIRAARTLYAEIGHQVARNGYDSISRRAVVAPLRMSLLLVASLLKAQPTRRGSAPPVLEATRFLVVAVSAAHSGNAQPRPPKSTAVSDEGRVAWLIDLFVRLEQRELSGAGHPRGQPMPAEGWGGRRRASGA